MAKNRKGLIPLIVGAVAGAAAVFFSDEKNRTKAKKTLAEVKKNPENFARRTVKSAQKTAKKLVGQAKTAGKKAINQHKRKTTVIKIKK